MISLSSLLLRKIHYLELLYLSVFLFVVTTQWDFYLFTLFTNIFAKFATLYSKKYGWQEKQTNGKQNKTSTGTKLGKNGVTVMVAHESRFKSRIITTNINLVETYLKCQKRSTWYGRRQPAAVEWRETLDHVVFCAVLKSEGVWAL